MVRRYDLKGLVTCTRDPPCVQYTSFSTMMKDRPEESKMAEEKKKSELPNMSFAVKYSSCRWIIGYMCCVARFVQAALRQVTGMAVVCMTLEDVPGSNKTASDNSTVPPGEDKFAEFQWSSAFEGWMLSAYTWGFIVTPIVGGFLATHFGSKRLVAVAMAVGGLATVLTPQATRLHPALIIVLRVIVGLVMGTVDPSVQALWSKWAPKYEKAQLTTCAYSGVHIAGMLTFFVSGYLCLIRLDNGWPFVFYVFGGLSLLSVPLWWYFVYDSPEEHPRVSEAELKYITSGTSHNAKKTVGRTPWLKIALSGPVWAIIICHIAYSWVNGWVVTYLPMYMKQILKFEVEEDGLYSSFPFIFRFITGLGCGYLADFLLQRSILGVGGIRKAFQFIGCAGCAACIFVCGYLDHRQGALAVFLLILGLCFQNVTSVGFRINHLDIAPRYAGVLMGITVTCAFAASISAPIITSAVVVEETREEWQIVFWIVGSLNVLGGLVFVVFGSGEEQKWAKAPEETKDVEMTVSDKKESDAEDTKEKSTDLDTTQANGRAAQPGDTDFSQGVVNQGFTIRM